jgi:uncharacterized membrane protein
MLGLSSLGFIHTVISVIALLSASWSLARHGQMSPRTRVGQVYVLATLLTAITALFIFQRGGIGPGHAMAVATLLALLTWYLAVYTNKAGRWSRQVSIISFTSTLLFHFLAGATETLTRVPPSQPLLPGPQAPQLLLIFAGIVAVCVMLGWWQWRTQRSKAA